jgi:hypothetical protein
MLIGLILVGAVLLLGFGFAAWVYPGFLNAPATSENDQQDGLTEGNGEEEPLAYVPEERTFLFGMNVGLLRSHLSSEQLDQLVNRLDRLNTKRPRGVDVAAGVKECDRYVMAIDAADKERIVVLKTGRPYNQKEMSKLLHMKQQPQIAKHKIFYVIPSQTGRRGPIMPKNPFKDEGPPPIPEISYPWIVGMPNDRVLFAGQLSQELLENLLTADSSRAQVEADMVKRVPKGPATVMWFVSRRGDPLRKLLRRYCPDDLLNVAGMIENGGMAWGSITLADQVQLELSLECANASTARKVVKEFQNYWNGEGKSAVMGLGLIYQGDVQTFLEEVSSSLKITAKGKIARLSCHVRKETLRKGMDALRKVLRN